MTDKIVTKIFLEEYYDLSFSMFENCCGARWCCIRKKKLNEFKRNGFRSFNLNVKKWKLLEDLNTFRISPIYQNTESYCNIIL